MNYHTKNKVVAKSDADIAVRQPLKVEEENQRRYVRLEIISPATLRRIKDVFGNYSASGEREIEATVLNLSIGGVLVDLSEPLNEGDVVGMRFNVNGIEPLDSVLGIVKRCDTDQDGHLAGIQFVDRRHLSDHLTSAELELLADHFRDFEQTVRQVLGNYIYRENR